jgi:TRAP transporter TAXI family solute receptor
MKHRMVRIVVFSCILLGAFGSVFAQTKLPRFIEIGTAGTGGAYYPIGIAMAEILTQKLKIQATAQVTGGAVENIRLIQEGSVKIALTTTANAYRGLKGLPPFTKPSPKVAGLFSNLTQGVYQIAVRENAGIKTLQDLKGKRVSLGPQGGLGVELSNYVFTAAGFSIADVKATFLSYEESATMMDDGNLDAVVIQTALPNPALRQLQSTGKKFNVISLPANVIQKVSSDHPYFEAFTIPASMYNTAADVQTLNGTNMAIIDKDLSEDVVYQIVKALMEDMDKIRASQPAAKGFNLEKAAIMPIPLHPGAERYYRERNVIK